MFSLPFGVTSLKKDFVYLVAPNKNKKLHLPGIHSGKLTARFCPWKVVIFQSLPDFQLGLVGCEKTRNPWSPWFTWMCFCWWCFAICIPTIWGFFPTSQQAHLSSGVSKVIQVITIFQNSPFGRRLLELPPGIEHPCKSKFEGYEIWKS